MKLLSLALCFFTSCTTVRYARLLPLTTNERAQFTCEELDNEIADARKFKATLGSQGLNVGAEVAAVVGDFGIGNAMEREGARKSADDRIASCVAARKEKGCPLNVDEQAALDAHAAMLASPAASFKRWHGRHDPHGCYHTNLDCPEGQRIPMEDRVEGTGPRIHCRACIELERQ